MRTNKKSLSCVSDPRINRESAWGIEAENGSDPMHSIEDLVAIGLMDKDHRCMEPTCPLYELPRTQKAFQPLVAFDFCGGCKTAMNMRVQDPLYDLSRSWMEASEAADDLLPLPQPLIDRLDAMCAEML